MSYTAVPTVVAGNVYTPTMYNTYLQNNADSGFLRMVADSTLGVDAASFDFTSIPATFAHLMLVLYAKSAVAAATDAVAIRLNNDTVANYFYQSLIGAAAVASASASASQTQGGCGIVPGSTGPAATEFGESIIFIPHYTQATNRKTWLALGGSYGSASDVRLIAGQESGLVAAINRVTIFCSGGNLKAGSRATLYGLPQ